MREVGPSGSPGRLTVLKTRSTASFPAMCLAFLRMRVEEERVRLPKGRERALLAIWTLLVIVPPSQAVGQEESSNARIPAGSAQALREVQKSLRAYYRMWSHFDPRYVVPARQYGEHSGSCFADQGDQCYPEPWGGCQSFGGRCKRLEEKGEFALELRDISRAHPDSPLALTQAVYAAIRFGFVEVASDLLAECSPEKVWWCDLAAGHLLHRTGQSVESEPLFHRALGAMPPDLRLYLEDVSALLPEPNRALYESLPAEGRSDFHAFIWWLADPFYSEDGNDRRAEHIVRRLERILYKTLMTAFYGRSAGARLGEAGDGEFVRRGWRDSFNGVRMTRGFAGGWDPFTSKKAAFNHFVPDVLSLSGLDEALAYRLEAKLEDEGYTRASGPVVQLPSQVARFREGDSLIVAMASDLKAAGVVSETDEAGPGSGGEVFSASQEWGTGQVHFFTSQGPGHVAFFDPAPVRDRAVMAGRVSNQTQLIGVEVFPPGASARDRRVLVPLGDEERLLSDLLFFRPMGPDVPRTRMGAVALMHGSPEVPKDRELGVYWEGYGIPAADSVEISLRLKGEEGGWLSELGRAVGLVGEVHEGALTWREPTGEGSPFARAISLNVSGLDEGEYELVLSMALADGEVLTRSRTFRVVEGGGR